MGSVNEYDNDIVASNELHEKKNNLTEMEGAMVSLLAGAQYLPDESHKETVSSIIKSRLKHTHQHAWGKRDLSLGYPVNQKFDYTELSPFLNIHLNNAGDPYQAHSTLLNTRDFEQEVLDYFSWLWNAKPRTPLSSESCWGYILGMGATEGNMYALWSAREYFSVRSGSELADKKTMRNPIIFYSQESHYSIEKCARVLGLMTFQDAGNRCYPGQCPVTVDGEWPAGIPVDQHGATDPTLLRDIVGFFAEQGHPPIIVLNIGSTFQGAFDDPSAIWQFLSPVLEQQGFSIQTGGESRPDCWIHIDGALGAAYLPYLEMANSSKDKTPCFDFRLPWIHSIVMSSHKWYGSPFASGIYMSKEKYRMKAATDPEYIDSPDTTLCGSRNGLSALLLWYAITSVTPEMQAEIAKNCEQLAAYACEQLTPLMQRNPLFSVTRGPHSLVVIFTRPQDRIFKKFQLSGRGEFAHIVVMPHVTRSAIDRLVSALWQEDAFS